MEPQDAPAPLAALVRLGRRLFDAAACSVAVLEPDEEHLRFRAADGAGADGVVGLRLPVSRGIAGWVVASGQPIAVHDVRADPRFAVDVAESTGYVPRSILAAPVTAAGEPIGVMEVLDRGTPGRDDMAVLDLLATQAGVVVQLERATADVPPDVADLLAEVGRLDPAERALATGLLRLFLDYLGRRGGPAGLG
jgi:GAF domain-containing protein